MAVKFTNNAKTTLASGITSTATSATVVDGSVFPTLGAGEYFYCTFDDTTNNEIVKVTARSSNTLTIVRGVDNTTARAFSSGDAAELRATAGLLTDIQENIAAKSANQTVYNTTTASSATDYDIGIDPSVEANAMVFLNGVMQHHDTFSFSGSTLTFDTAPSDGMALEVIVDNLINLQSSNLTVDTFTAADVGGNPQTDFTLSDSPAAETNLIVFVDGVFQDQDAYTISSNVLTMTDGVIADRVVTVYVINPVNIGTPSDGTVTSAKLSGNITMPADLTVTGDVAFDSPTFVVDNANSRVGIGTAAPSTLLDIVGDVKMSADLTVDTNTLYVDSANNRVGVGTISPDVTMHIAGTTYIEVENSNAFLNIKGDNSAFSGIYFRDQQGIAGEISYDHSVNLFKIWSGANTSGNPAMTIKDTFIDASEMSGYLKLPSGTTAERPTPTVGMIRYNQTESKTEIYQDSEWKPIATTSFPYDVEYVVVAGGGGGGNGAFGDAAGGAGGGGYRSSVSGESSGRGSSAESVITLSVGQVYTATVGAGGSGGNVGGDSSISGSDITTVTSNGGGAGGNRQGSNTKDGGCGGGGAYLYTGAGSGTAGQGYDGGVYSGNPYVPGAGGGGSGGTATGTDNEVGGVGTSTSITGSSVTYSAGGHGGNATNGASPVAGSANTGDGGGGYYGGGGNGASGGSGVVILKVPTANYSGTTTGSPTITTSGSYTIIKFTSSGSYTG